MNDSSRQTKHLKDYAPPDYRIDTVALDVGLAPKAARVVSKLEMRPNPEAATGGQPLVLDGAALTLERITLDGKALAAGDYILSPGKLTISNVPAQPFTLEITTLCDPEANTELSGLYRSSGTYCTSASLKASAASPTSWTGRTCLPSIRCASRPTATHRCCSPTAIRWSPARSLARTGIMPSGTTPSRSRPISSRWSAAISPRSTTPSPPPPERRSRSPSMLSRARRIAAAGPWSR